VLAGSEQKDPSGVRNRLDFGGVNAIARSLVTASLVCHGHDHTASAGATIAFRCADAAHHKNNPPAFVDLVLAKGGAFKGHAETPAMVGVGLSPALRLVMPSFRARDQRCPQSSTSVPRASCVTPAALDAGAALEIELTLTVANVDDQRCAHVADHPGLR
jgi:hypothetical protein